jgi:STE24 endopeptidase
VFRIDLSRRTTAANAALVGLGRTRRVVIGDTLIERFPPDEIEAVFAHELGHHVHHDTARLVAGQSALNLVGLFIVSRVLALGIPAFGFRSLADVAAFPLLALGLAAFGAATAPIANAFSRLVEREADLYALRTASRPGAFASAMRRLADQNLSEYRPERWVELLLYSHPAPYRRVASAEEFVRLEGGAR